ncbi:homoserine dehydrogenase [Staphylococcus auricularis]|uniref:Homoserine dehydrogenase n=1 Tax=Staphylococcus auricularis TaxID=29379 RepID=A0AAP8TU75_9STAP|nr:homoserine dehydrogenase [Staphylococcus auricularis]MDC6326593.1 homoserine dehydrogenase [Staphylococcus auricularis]MDN4532470.1 homoserine dehydrogenase [Staphylococcus auricularis]PNZ69599.1 homoserine dehydrogenase [Staphylococcus auricularis]QPT05410.1 homoserine dehydrogenase [Staphylococcus auricularis]SQJ11248.1 homoserine dehydrogenase [Staphylococcus auricularis]
MKVLNIAILGLGTVGSGVVKIIEENNDQIKATINKDIHIQHILVRDKNKSRPINISRYHLTEDINEILADDEVDIVVEVMGGIEPTVDWLKQALQQSKHVITANKDLLAVHLKELEALAEEQGVALKYEASVAGGIPIVNAINNGLNANNINKFMGILNGTSNFILTKMTHEHTSFEQALEEAQALGFAEADPTDDVEGIDAARKVVITSYLSFNQVINLADVTRTGIREVALADIETADAFDCNIKLIGKGTYDQGKVTASVEPTLIHKSHQLAAVDYEYNAIYVIGDAVGETMFYGKGAGSLATGSAVASDLLNVALQFESNLHTLPPHFELKTEKTKALIDSDQAISIKEKQNYYVVIQTEGQDIEALTQSIKKALPIHKTLDIKTRDKATVALFIIGIDIDPQSYIEEAGFKVEKIYPIEGV